MKYITVFETDYNIVRVKGKLPTMDDRHHRKALRRANKAILMLSEAMWSMGKILENIKVKNT